MSEDKKITVTTWFERDRASVIVYQGEDTVIEWWDEAVYEAVEDGFLNPENWEESAIEYCKLLGLLKDGDYCE